ncbi:MAG: PHP domain-containing protein [Anaerovoracaceae bacterium]|jgi:putative hydrolase
MYDRMKFDWHTHTTYSHGKGSVEDNVLEARRKGLESVAISDHGPGHFGYGFKRSEIPAMRRDIDEMNRKYDDIKVYMSVEANIINPSGLLDVKPEEFQYYDFVIAGYHFGTLGESPAASLALHAKNLVGSYTHHFSDALIEKNTKMVVESLHRNKIRTLTHPGDKGKVDLDQVFKACEETGTWLEISNRHKQLTVDEIKLAMKYDVKFILGSDAHVPEKVGGCERALERVREAGLEPERIVNLI